MTTEERIKQFEEAAIKRMEEFSVKYPKDIGCLYESYLKLKEQGHPNEFLNGYIATISDLIIIKQGHWGK